MTMRLLQLSDTHVGAGQNYAFLRWIVTWIITHLNSAEWVIGITGDLVDSPSIPAYRAISNLIEKLRDAGFDVLPVPGNHDLHYVGLDAGFGQEVGREMWREWIDPVSSWRSNDQWPRTYDADGVTIIGIDTNAGTSGNWMVDIAKGMVGRDQLLELVLLVQDLHNVVLGHHRLMWDDAFHRLIDADELLQVLIDQSMGYVCGHQHKQDTWEEGGLAGRASRRTTQPEGEVLQLTGLELVPGLPFEIMDVGMPVHKAA
jgi:3',5'-cyclic AMP phosphodiesterase CpdA